MVGKSSVRAIPLAGTLPPPRRQFPIVKLPPRPQHLVTPFEALDWTVTTHICPAAYPQSRQLATPSLLLQSDERLAGKELEDAVDKLFQRQRERPVSVENAASWKGQEPLLQTVNRYVPKTMRPRKGKPGLTLILAHANGLHKETWEPTLSQLIKQFGQRYPNLYIDEIWALDALDEGDSGILNVNTPAVTYDWDDHGRDIVTFLSEYLPYETNSTPPPLLLPIHPPVASYPSRRLVGVGHSLGSAGVCSAAATLPHLFSTLIFVDTTMIPPQQSNGANAAGLNGRSGLVAGALVRRDRWPKGRDEARTGFLKNRHFFGKWSSDVLERYVQFALWDDGTAPGAVTLKCRRQHEAAVFADPDRISVQKAWKRLSLLPASVKVHFIFAGIAPLVSVEQQDNCLAGVEQSQATKSSVAGAGHLIVQEKPIDLGNEIGDVLARHFPSSSKL